MKKVLVVTYYWPPSGGAGVQRWLKFVKYLRRYQWEPVVYTPENPEAPAEDVTLLSDVPDGLEVIKTRIWEPYTIYKRITGRKKDEKVKAGFLSEKKTGSPLESFSIWVRGNLFIPDARKYWIKPSVRFLNEYLRDHPVDVMATNGPPHSMHLIGLRLKKRFDIPWLADFRDPWTGIDFYDQLKLSSQADRKHKKLEQMVVSNADRLTTVSWSWAEELKDLGGREVSVITNGYDPEDFMIPPVETPGSFMITHIGALNRDRNTPVFWKMLAEKCRSEEQFSRDLRIRFIGFTDVSVFESLEECGLSGKVEKPGYLPHNEAMKLASGSALLFLPLNNTPNVKGIIPGKIFEYLALKRPVVCIGPEDGDSARILKETEAGYVAGFGNAEGMKRIIDETYNRFRKNTLNVPGDKIGQYSRIEKTGELAEILNDML